MEYYPGYTVPIPVPPLQDVHALVFDLQRGDERESAVLELSKRRESLKDLAPILWHSFGASAFKQQALNKSTSCSGRVRVLAWSGRASPVPRHFGQKQFTSCQLHLFAKRHPPAIASFTSKNSPASPAIASLASLFGKKTSLSSHGRLDVLLQDNQPSSVGSPVASFSSHRKRIQSARSGTMVLLIQDIVQIYPQLAQPASLTPSASNRVCNSLALLQCVASNAETRCRTWWSFSHTGCPFLVGFRWIHHPS